MNLNIGEGEKNYSQGKVRYEKSSVSLCVLKKFDEYGSSISSGEPQMNVRARGKAVRGVLTTPFACHSSVTSRDIPQIDSLFAGCD